MCSFAAKSTTTLANGQSDLWKVHVKTCSAMIVWTLGRVVSAREAYEMLVDGLYRGMGGDETLGVAGSERSIKLDPASLT